MARPVLARPWVYMPNVSDLSHRPSWLSRPQQRFAENLFAASGIHAQPVLVADTLYKMKGVSPQVAFAGRSNVGKSTLLNMLVHGQPDPLQGKYLTEKRKLESPTCAPVSSKPGRTRHLFRFELGGKLTLVDLPGYGYAKAPEESRYAWSTLVDEYLKKSKNLKCTISLVDAVIGVKTSDEQLWEMLQRGRHQMMVVLTKADKVTPEGLNKTMAQVISRMQWLDDAYLWPYVHAVSGFRGHGVDELRCALSTIASDAAGGLRHSTTPSRADRQQQQQQQVHKGRKPSRHDEDRKANGKFGPVGI